MLARIRKSIDEKDAGFTLVELLVVMIIIGILAAIAIPVFLNQRTKANDTGVKSDLRTVAQEMETFFVDNQAYPTVAETATIVGDLNLTEGNVIVSTTAGGESYCLQGSNPNSNAEGGDFFWVDSMLGGLQPGAPTPAAPTGGACTATASAPTP